jgi:hypothetical protein
MTRIYRWVAFVVALVLAVPAMAQPAVPAAEKGEVVIVSLRDGRTITGAIGEWADQLGFQVIPADGVPYFVRVSEILTIQSAATGAGRGLPSRESRHRPGVGTGIAIGLAIPFVIGILIRFVGCPAKGCA